MYGVYIVDDEMMVVDDLLGSMLWLENGFEVVGWNTNAQKALDEIVEKRPAVVFSDLKMPGMDGVELIRRLKANGVETEFVILSAYGEFEATREFFLMGGFDYLLKPFDPDKATPVLEALSRRLLEKHNCRPKVRFTPSQSKGFDDVVAYVTENFNTRLTLGELSRDFNMSPTYICDLFAKHYESTLSIFVTNLRMREAGELIKDTDTPLKEIAIFCGYSNYVHFCRIFKAHFGVSPSEYREGGDGSRGAQ